MTSTTESARRQQNRELIATFLSDVDRDVDEFFTEWKDMRMFVTDDPDTFWVEASGEGVMRMHGAERPYVQTDYFLCFEMQDGKIARYREIMNALELLTTVGGRVELPPLPPQDY